jgi:macrolide-specific efflux system membrane fusion protein
MQRRTLLVNGGLGALLATGGTTGYLMLKGDQQPAAAGTQRTVAVQQGTVTATVTADGSVKAVNTMAASFATAGTITEIKVKVGDVVAAGAILATVDATDANADLTTAKRNRTSAKDQLARANAAVPVNEDNVRNAQNQVDSAETSVKSAQRKVDGTVLKAPMAGTIIAINAAVGAQSGTSAFAQISDLNALQIEASVPEADAARLKPEQVAAVAWNALAGVTATGKVTAISPTAATGNTVSYPIYISLDKNPDGVRLGQSVRITVTVDKAENVLFLPTAAVRSAGNRNSVTVVTNGVQETRTVQIGLKGDTSTVITEGLTLGEQVVLATASTTTGTNQQQFQLPGGQVPGGGTGTRPGGGTR